MSDRQPRIHHLARFELECGDVLHDVRQAYLLDGELNERRDNLVVVFHALTGTANAVGDWWSEVIGPGKAVDTRRYAVLCTNLLGSCYGTTGPWEPERRPFPQVTTRDMARFVHRLVEEELGVERVALAIGGSLGGMVALEWAASFPELTDAIVVLAAPAAHSAAAIGWNHIQRRAIELAGEDGLEVARMIAMMTYRTPEEFAERFGRRQDAEGGFEMANYLSHHGQKLRDRFDSHSYVALLNAMDSHDVGRGRGGIARALQAVKGRLLGVGIPGDVLYSDAEVRAWAKAAGAEYREIRSIRGHDAFLLEPAQLSAILEEVVAEELIEVAEVRRAVG